MQKTYFNSKIFLVGRTVMVSFSDMHTISYFANIFLPFGLGLFLQGAPSNFQRYHPCSFVINMIIFICGWQSLCSLADVPHPRLLLVSLTPIKFSIVNSSLIIEREFSPILLETVTVLMHFNLLSLWLVINTRAVEFAKSG